MEISRLRALRGPNLWSRHTSIEAVVSCNEAERNIDGLTNFEPRLRARFPELKFQEPADPSHPMSMAHALEAAALCLQAQAGCPVTFSREIGRAHV